MGPRRGRHAAIAQELGNDGQWLVPRLYGEPYYDKPTLFYWIVRSSFATFGTNELAARLPSVLATLATLVIVHRFARDRLGRRRCDRGRDLCDGPARRRPRSLQPRRDSHPLRDLGLHRLARLARRIENASPWSAYLAMALGTLLKVPSRCCSPGSPRWPWRCGAERCASCSRALARLTERS